MAINYILTWIGIKCFGFMYDYVIFSSGEYITTIAFSKDKFHLYQFCKNIVESYEQDEIIKDA